MQTHFSDAGNFINYIAKLADPSTSWKNESVNLSSLDQLIKNSVHLILAQMENPETAPKLQKSLFAISKRISEEQAFNTPQGADLAFKVASCTMGILFLGSKFEWTNAYNPDALQLILLKSLPNTSQRENVRRLADYQLVSKEWNKNAEIMKKNWVHQGVISIEESYGCKTSTQAIECIINKGLLRADLHPYINITDNDLKNLDQCPNLNHLTVESSEIRRFPLEKLTNLQTLRLLAPNISGDGLTEGLKALKQLTSLSLDTLGKGDKIKFAKGLKTLSQLKTLMLRNFASSGGDIMVDALKNLNQLTHLELNHCRSLSANKLANTLKTLSELIVLSLSDSKISGSEFVAMLKEQNQLTVLNLAYCEFSDDELTEVLQGFTKLSSLNLSFRKHFSSHGVKILKNLSQLSDLDLSYCHQMLSIYEPEEFRNLSKLTTLNLTGCDRIQEHHLAEVLKNLPQLTTLNLTSCQQLTGTNLGEAFKSLPHLKCVVLKGCDYFTKEKLDEWKKEYPKINFTF